MTNGDDDPAGGYAGIHLVPLFAEATHWKRYFARFLAPYVAGDVLEVGSADGATTEYVRTARARSWLCLDPDPVLARAAQERFRNGSHPGVEIRTGTVFDLPADQRFDTVLYLDVLEHIADDRAEALHAISRLRPEGHLIVLAPAHQFLFTRFDSAVGHQRRYSLTSLLAVLDGAAVVVDARYLDAAGLLASLGNRLFLSSGTPTRSQLRFWDRMLIPISRFLDPLLRHRVGKSVLVVWRPRPLDATTPQLFR